MDAEREPGTETPRTVMASLLASGFPLQTAIAQVTRTVPNWAVVRQEIPWDDGGGPQFLDLVVRKLPHLIVAVECKKTAKEAWTFLQPGGTKSNVQRTRCLHTHQIPDSTRRIELFSSEWLITPESAEAMFCVVSTSDSGKDSRLLERDAQLLIRGTEAWATWFKEQFKEKDPQVDRLILPVIVTTAKLFVAEYDPSQLSLDTGTLDARTTSITPVDWVRFRKAFTSQRSSGEDDRTVFVVRAFAYQQWLEQLTAAAFPIPQSELHVPTGVY